MEPVKDWRTELHPVFAACVAAVPSRYGIETPFVVNGWLAATDGRIVVRILKPAGIETILPPSGVMPPPIDDVYRGEFGDAVPIPAVEPRDERIDCSECSGSGTCRRCSCGTEHECGECRGEGTVKRMGLPVVVIEGQNAIQDLYLLRLAKFPGVMLYPPKEKKIAPWKFTIGEDIEGRLMPMS